MINYSQISNTLAIRENYSYEEKKRERANLIVLIVEFTEVNARARLIEKSLVFGEWSCGLALYQILAIKKSV